MVLLVDGASANGNKGGQVKAPEFCVQVMDLSGGGGFARGA